MTVGDFHELAVGLWQAGNINSLKRPDFRQVDLLAEIARNGIISEYLSANADLLDEFYTPFVVSVSFDSARNKKYSNLPSNTTDLRESLIMISSVQNESEQFIHQGSGDEWLFKGLDAETAEGQSMYRIEGRKVWYKNIPAEFTDVLIRMVADIKGLPDTAVFPVPNMFEARVLDYVLSKLQIQETVNLKDEDKP